MESPDLNHVNIIPTFIANHHISNWTKTSVKGVGIGLLVSLVIGAGVWNHFQNHLLPGSKVGDHDVGYLSYAAALDKLKTLEHKINNSLPIKIEVELASEPLDPEKLDFRIDAQGTIDQLRQDQKQLLIPNKIASVMMGARPQVLIKFDYNQAYLASLSASLKNKVTTEYQEPSLKVDTGLMGKASLRFTQGIVGKTFDSEIIRTIFNDHLMSGKAPPGNYQTSEIGQVASEDQINQSLSLAGVLENLSLELIATSGGETISTKLNYPDLVSLIKVDKGEFNEERIGEQLENISLRVNKDPIEANFSLNGESNRALEFTPPEPGYILDMTHSQLAAEAALNELVLSKQSKKVFLQVSLIPPQSELSNTNRLGIKELVGEATSHYQGSIANRVFNVGLAASRINGAIVPPGQVFSTNSFLGDVSKSSGYKEAYVIKEGRTQLGDGGGVCQVSTTLFRAALNAGFPITERRGHSYRVGYYEQDAKPGLDATVFAPSTDFKFENNSPAHIVVLAKADNANRTLTVKIFGTHDGRKSEISNHVVFDITPALPNVMIDDPSLKPGQVKQIDWSAPGAKAKFHYSVTRDGELIYEKDFLTVYQPWASVFLQGPR